MMQFIIWGTDRFGKRYPDVTGFTTDMDEVVSDYRLVYPKVIRVVIDVALQYDKNS